MKKISILFSLSVLALILVITGEAQTPFQIKLEPILIKNFNGIQSYSWASIGDKILIIGGRTDGLHKKQPFASFRPEYNNTNLIVLDIANEKIWEKSVLELPATIADQLQSSNMEFFQVDNQLLLVGGYGYSTIKKDHITYPFLINIQVKELINAIVQHENILPHIQQLPDERMAVTGGHLGWLDNSFLLVGGQRFDGRYNPHGPDHGPGFKQVYTNEIRKFTLGSVDGKLRIEKYNSKYDSLLLHRRDYNLLPQFDQNGKEIYTIFSGVFQYDKDVPFTTLVDITAKNHQEVPAFNQEFCHYHTASLPIYSKAKNSMYSIFFGGIGQTYLDSAGNKVNDDNVPFVKTISVIERTKGSTREITLPESMPGFFGAAAEFVPVNESNYSENRILILDRLDDKPTTVGYIIGGIDSRAQNVFWTGGADSNRASPVIWKVTISKN